jgi:hypothetical protein
VIVGINPKKWMMDIVSSSLFFLKDNNSRNSTIKHQA